MAAGRFSRAVARYVQESVWHASQRLTLEEEGSVLAEFCLSNTEEAKRWLLGFGRHAVVLEPAQLREELIAEAQSLLRQYESGALELAGI